MADPRPRALYRIFNADGQLLYVGISVDVGHRLACHSRRGWWTEVATITVQHFATERQALEAERDAILNEHPLHNLRSVPTGGR